MKSAKIDDPIYGAAITLFWDFTEDEANRQYEQLGHNSSWQNQAGSFIELENYHTYYIFVQGRACDNMTLTTLAHEVLHLTHRVLQLVGLKLTDDTQEAFTYWFQYIFYQCAETIRRRSRRRK